MSENSESLSVDEKLQKLIEEGKTTEVETIKVAAEAAAHLVELWRINATKQIVRINDRIKNLLENMFMTPQMWGDPMAVELQVLLLLDMRSHLQSAKELESRFVMDTYLGWLGSNYGRSNIPLCQLMSVNPDAVNPSSDFIMALRAFDTFLDKLVSAMNA